MWHTHFALSSLDQAEQHCTLSVQVASCLYTTVLINTLSGGFVDCLSNLQIPVYLVSRSVFPSYGGGLHHLEIC